MARYTGPKRRLSRREGLALFAKDAKAIERKGAVPPGQHGLGRRRRISEYGVQLREKQKAKRIFGLLEKQFKRYFVQALKFPKATGIRLLQLLELRLDNIIYRLGFAPTRVAARQFVAHGHVQVNQKKLNIPSYQVKVGDVISLRPKILEYSVVKELVTKKNAVIPKWLERKGAVGRVTREPERDEIDADINENLVVEYYSR